MKRLREKSKNHVGTRNKEFMFHCTRPDFTELINSRAETDWCNHKPFKNGIPKATQLIRKTTPS